MKRKCLMVMGLLFLGMALILPLFAGGGAEQQKPAGGASSAPSTTPKGPPKFIEDDKTISGTIKFWIPFSGPQGMDLMIKEFNSVFPNIKIELTPYNNNANGNIGVTTALMAGEIDVLHSFELSNAYNRWEGGLYRDITDALLADNIDLKTEWGTGAYQYEGRIYTIPAGSLSYYIAINMTEWNKAGLGPLPMSWTWDEYIEASRKMTHGSGDSKVYGGSDYQLPRYAAMPFSQVHGIGSLYNADGTSSFDSPVILRALKREIKAELEDQIWFPLIRYRSDGLQAQMTFLRHQTASVIINNVQRFLRDKTNYPVDWITGFAPYPTDEKGQANHMEGVSAFSHVGIASQSPESKYKANYAFLKWYATEGCKYLVIAGHLPSWTKTDVNGVLPLIFGSDEEAAKLVDVESFKRVVFNYSAPNWIDKYTTAYSEVMAIFDDAVMNVHNKLKTPEQALEDAKRDADKAIQAAK
jgi:multiple sugar transport system substrate-binding protein